MNQRSIFRFSLLFGICSLSSLHAVEKQPLKTDLVVQLNSENWFLQTQEDGSISFAHRTQPIEGELRALRADGVSSKAYSQQFISDISKKCVGVGPTELTEVFYKVDPTPRKIYLSAASCRSPHVSTFLRVFDDGQRLYSFWTKLQSFQPNKALAKRVI